ncbi:transglutaminaseTgpA domain-containing protein [Undibacterium sp. SXout11W]|uniref:transglutaminase family protein n=1 Tax=Undibacterium sp. SXout11W TaxID=3413050 RepID=UPI003BF1A393
MMRLNLPSRLSSRILSRDKVDTLLLLTACLCVLLPHASHVTWWVNLACGGLLSWRAWLTFNGRRLPPSWLLLPIAGLMMVGVYLTHHTFLGREAGVTMLVLLLTCKLLEMHAKRDLFVVIFLSFFLLLSSFFYQQSIGAAALALLGTALLITAQLSFQYTNLVPSLGQKFKLAGTLVGLAIPLTLCAFLLFPRIPGPLWGLPGDAHSARTGLSETMAPGGISELVQSEEIAFRAKFDQPISNKSVLYWRGVVLTAFDGRTWSPKTTRLGKKSANSEFSGDLIQQEIILEPQNQRWIFALDLPVEPAVFADKNTSNLNADMELRSAEPILERLRYEVRSATKYKYLPDLRDEELAASLALPAGYNPRTVSFAQDLRHRHKDDQQLIKAVLDFFRKEEFNYTLEPPLLGTNSVDDFLFKSRAGFCEHFASSFVILMRAADIPARVVTGYQGGTKNDVDGYFEIRQSDAHAWAEVWLRNQGWVRIDPTAAVAPERVMLNLARAIPQRGLAGLVGQAVSGNPWVQALHMRWDAVNNSWNQWVLNYNQNSQRHLLDSLGFKNVDWAQISLVFFIVGSIAISVVGLPLVLNKPTIPAIDSVYFSFCKLMAKHTEPRGINEGPQAFLWRLRLALPAEKILPAEHFLNFYIAAKYGKHDLPESSITKRLKALLAACK